MPQVEQRASVDYENVTRELARTVRTRAPLGYDQGRARMATAVKDHLGCTLTRARHVVSSLVEKGYVRFGPHPHFNTPEFGQWTYHPLANSA